MPRPKKTVSPMPEPVVKGRYVNPTNKAQRLKDLKRTYRMPTNKIRKPKVNLETLIKKSDLKSQGWTDREITQIKRYAVLSNEFNNIKRAYEDTLGDLKETNSEVINKLNQLGGSSVLLNESLLINVITKKSPTSGIKADALAKKVEERFGNLLSQYNIDLQAIIQELEDEAKANQKYYTALEIGRDDYSSHLQQSYRRNHGRSLKEFDFSGVKSWLSQAYDSVVDFFSRIGSFLSSLLEEKADLEATMIQMLALQENKGQISKYPRLYN